MWAFRSARCSPFCIACTVLRRPLNGPRRILVILLSEMGSLVLAHGMFERLKHTYPGASIHALVFAKNREVLDLLDIIPPDNVLTISDRSLGQFTADSVRVLRAIGRWRSMS